MKSFKEKMKEKIKVNSNLYFILMFFKHKEERVRFKLRRIVMFPSWHANYMRKKSTLCNYGTFPRTKKINLKNPIYFDDKLAWLKYYNYNKNELVYKCYDKYLVRDYVEECGLGYILNDLYLCTDNPKNINWNKLPDEYVIKKSNDSGHVIFKYKDSNLDDIKKEFNELVLEEKKRKKLYKANGDLFAIKNKQLYIFEKRLISNNGDICPADYKFYCFNGEPKYLAYMYEREIGKKHKDIFLDIKLNDRSDLFYSSEIEQIDRPKCYDEMLEICRKLSKPFPFVRVDLYVNNDQPIFGELTFSPAGGNGIKHAFKKDLSFNEDALKEMGNLIDLNYKSNI